MQIRAAYFVIEPHISKDPSRINFNAPSRLTTMNVLALAPLITTAAAGFIAAAWSHDGSLRGEEINVVGNHFYIGLPPLAFCPDNIPGPSCSELPGDKTVFSGGQDVLSLAVSVPGGQQGTAAGFLTVPFLPPVFLP